MRMEPSLSHDELLALMEFATKHKMTVDVALDAMRTFGCAPREEISYPAIATINGHSARRVGPKVQFNFRCSSETKNRAILAAVDADMNVGDWLEQLILSATEEKAA
jgi:hypothetical protein